MVLSQLINRTLTHTYSNMSVSKQLAMNMAVNGVYIPMEIINIIKSFAFEEQIVAFIKLKKKEIINHFNTAIYSRQNVSWWITETSENWIFMFANQTKPIQSNNCGVCGNYMFTTNPKINCACVRNNEFDHDHDEFDHDHDDFDHDDLDQHDFDFDDNPGDLYNDSNEDYW